MYLDVIIYLCTSINAYTYDGISDSLLFPLNLVTIIYYLENCLFIIDIKTNITNIFKTKSFKINI